MNFEVEDERSNEKKINCFGFVTIHALIFCEWITIAPKVVNMAMHFMHNAGESDFFSSILQTIQSNAIK